MSIRVGTVSHNCTQVGFDAGQNTHAEIDFPGFQMVHIDGIHCRRARLVNA